MQKMNQVIDADAHEHECCIVEIQKILDCTIRSDLHYDTSDGQTFQIGPRQVQGQTSNRFAKSENESVASVPESQICELLSNLFVLQLSSRFLEDSRLGSVRSP